MNVKILPKSQEILGINILNFKVFLVQYTPKCCIGTRFEISFQYST